MLGRIGATTKSLSWLGLRANWRDHHAVELDELELWHSGPEQSRCVETKCGAQPGIACRPSRVLFVCGRGSKHVGVGVGNGCGGVAGWVGAWAGGRVAKLAGGFDRLAQPPCR